MLKIKVTTSAPSTKIKDSEGFSSISKFLPSGLTSYKNCQFFVNEDVKNPDYWVVIDDLEKSESCLVDPSKIFFLSAEVPFVTSYFYDKYFLLQFSKSFSPHAIYHIENTTSLPFLPFMINASHGSSILDYDYEYNYDKLIKRDKINKTKMLSVIASSKGSPNQKLTDFHEIRYQFFRKLKEEFKDKIDVFGYGHNEIKTKAEAIDPYKYHICLENQSTPNVITEKLYDSYLGLAYPIYWGAPNVCDYFPKDSLTSINIFDFKSSVQTIEKVLDENLFEKNFDQLISAKNAVLQKYGVFQRIAQICENDHKNSQRNAVQNVVLHNRSHFLVPEDNGQISKKKKSKKKKKKLTLIFLVSLALLTGFLLYERFNCF